MKPYDEIAARSALRTIRNRIVRFEPYSLLRLTISALNRISRPNDVKQWQALAPPWTLLTLLERIALAQRGLPTPSTTPATDKDFRDLIARLHAYGNHHTILPGDFDSVWSFARTMGFRQLWLQEVLQDIWLSRLELLFLHPVFEKALVAKVGFGVDEFLNVLSCLLSRFRDPDRSSVLTLDEVSIYSRILGNDAFERYLHTAAVSFEEMRERLARQYRLGSADEVAAEEQAFGQTPLWRTPFLRRSDGFELLGRPLLAIHARDFLIETLRQQVDAADVYDGKWFGREFGPIFEAYLRQGLKHAGFGDGAAGETGKAGVFFDEAWLKAHFGAGKVVDFAVVLDGAVLLVDAKGTVLRAEKRGVTTRAEVESALRGTVVKAVGQGLATARRMRDAPANGGQDFSKMKFFMLSVTPMDLFLSVGADFIENYAAAEYEAQAGSISKDSFFVASVHEWDMAMGHVADGANLAEALRNRVTKNATQKTLQFSQFLFPDDDGCSKAEYLRAGGHRRLARLLELLQKASSAA